MSDRPRLLLVPTLTEIEWVIKLALGEWADVAAYDSPGVGDEPLPVGDLDVKSIARRGIEEADACGWVRRVPLAITQHFDASRVVEGHGLGERLSSLDVPMMLAQHRDCLMFTKEGFEDAVAALPHGRVTGYYEKPSTSLDFCEDLRQFCTSLAPASA